MQATNSFVVPTSKAAFLAGVTAMRATEADPQFFAPPPRHVRPPVSAGPEPGEELLELDPPTAADPCSLASAAPWSPGVESPTGPAFADGAAGELSMDLHTSDTAIETASASAQFDDDGELWGVNQYSVIQPLGQGACGTVYLVEVSAGCRSPTVSFECGFPAEEPMFALKAIPRARAQAALADTGTHAEVAVMGQLSCHPHMVTLHEVIDDPSADMLYLVMSYAAGGSVATVDSATGACRYAGAPLTDEELDAFVDQQSSALGYLHSRGMVHADFKVENVLFSGSRDAAFEAKLADFGTSILTRGPRTVDLLASQSQSRSFNPVVVGTPYIRAPELFDGAAASVASDAWALGVAMYTLAFGRVPFPAFHSIAGLAAAVSDPPQQPPADADPTRAARFWPLISSLLTVDESARAVAFRQLSGASLQLAGWCPDDAEGWKKLSHDDNLTPLAACTGITRRRATLATHA